MHSADPAFRTRLSPDASMRSNVLRLSYALAAAAWAGPCFALAAVDTEVLTPAGDPVEDAVIYLRPLSGQRAEGRTPGSASIEQHDREFVPYLTVVQVGAAVRFPNQDPIRHHVYSFSSPKKFEIKLYAGEGPDPIVFDRPGVVTIGCNVHDWMLGFLFVVDSPWFGKTDAHGRVRIDSLPDGDYEARAWQPRQRRDALPQRLSLGAAAPDPLRFVLEVSPRKPRYKPPADTLHYSK
jgi:plastocyanin